MYNNKVQERLNFLSVGNFGSGAMYECDSKSILEFIIPLFFPSEWTKKEGHRAV